MSSSHPPPIQTPARCPQCGGDFDKGALCSYCHHGVLFAGRGHSFQLNNINCPRCEEAPLYEIRFRDLAIDVCIRCEGAWFDLGELESLLQKTRSDTRQGIFEAEGMRPGPVAAGIPPEGQAAYIRCPQCAIIMNRHNWEKRSGTVVDYCRSHGIWLDSSEISQLRSWAASTPEGPPVPLPRIESEAAAEALRRPLANWMDRPSSSFEARFVGGGVLGSIARMLETLFLG